MINEEAIKILKEHHDHWRRLHKEGICTEEEGENTIEALEMAIKAIKALEQEPCEDAISRDAVWDVMQELWGTSGELLDRLMALPSVNPQPKTGHWIEHPEIETSTPEYLMFYECSECGDRQCFCKSDIHKKRFCSNCGCRMVEPQERSDKE